MNFDEIWPKFDQIWTKIIKIWPDFTKDHQNLTRSHQKSCFSTILQCPISRLYLELFLIFVTQRFNIHVEILQFTIKRWDIGGEDLRWYPKSASSRHIGIWSIWCENVTKNNEISSKYHQIWSNFTKVSPNLVNLARILSHIHTRCPHVHIK